MKLARIVGAATGALAVACVLGVAPRPAEAAVVTHGCGGGDFGSACSLAELVGGGSLDINDKTFSNFGLETFAGSALNASAIRVDTIDSLANPGLTLVDTGGALTFANGAASFSNFTFDVAIVAGALRIGGSSLAVDVGNVTGGNSYTHVFTTTGLDAFCQVGTPSCANSLLTNSALISPTVTNLSVEVGIDIQSDVAGTAQLNSITLQVAQVPEPGSVALLAVGLVGVGAVLSRGRRRSQSAKA